MTNRITRGILIVAFLTLLFCAAFMLLAQKSTARKTLAAALEDEAAIIVSS